MDSWADGWTDGQRDGWIEGHSWLPGLMLPSYQALLAFCFAPHSPLSLPSSKTFLASIFSTFLLVSAMSLLVILSPS